jgi:competence protein ComEA
MLDPDRRHLIAYLAAAAVLVVIAVRFIASQGADAPPPSISMAAPATTPHRGGGARPRAAAARPSVWVDVVGAVREPGLYALQPGARVAAALDKAGGIRARADRAAVNLAAKVADGQQIVVPLRGRGGSALAGPPGAASAVGGSAAAGAPSTAGAGAAGSSLVPGATISLSNATQAQLEQLDGIGPALAGRIIQYREQHGGFRSIDQLQEVSGIGDKRFQALKGSVQP